MSRSVVILPKQAFLPDESIEMQISTTDKQISRIGVFVAPLDGSKKPLEWTLIQVTTPNAHVIFSERLSPGLYAIGTDTNKKIEICTILKVTESSIDFVETSSVFAMIGLVSCICLVKTLFSKTFRR